MRHYRQPVPAWRARQIAEQDAAREDRQHAIVGNIFGLDEPAFEEVRTTAEPDPLPIAQTEHHSIGREFILAGNAVFTVAGRETRYTFRVAQPRDDENRQPRDPNSPKPYFVSVLTGTGDHKYTYVGILNIGTGRIVPTRGSKIGLDAPAVKALSWMFDRIWAGKPLPAPAAIYHEGRCGRCGRPLTVPESILTGFGPDCAELLGIPMAAAK